MTRTMEDTPDVVEINGRRWTIEHIQFKGETYFRCGARPVHRDRAELIRDIEQTQDFAWRYR